ncbi:MAG TPA: hypothetical protein VIN60_05700 [Anaerolineales bacterium]
MKKSLSFVSVLYDLLIDAALMGMGYLIYYQFNIRPLAPIDWNPLVIQVFGSKQSATLILSGIPFAIGLLSVVQIMFRVLGALRPHSAKS